MAEVRVYHPTANAWQNVDDARVGEWTEQGWLKSKPKHVDDSEALPLVVSNAPQVKAESQPAKGDSK